MGAIQAVVGEQKSWVYWVGKHQGGFLEEVTSKLSELGGETSGRLPGGSDI